MSKPETSELKLARIKVVVGCINLANQLLVVKEVFNQLGCDVVTVGYNHLPQYYDKVDFDFDLESFTGIEERVQLLQQLIAESAIFYYIWPKVSVVHPQYDFQLIKQNNRFLIVQCVGDDIRPRKLYNKIIENYYKNKCHNLPENDSDEINTLTLKTVESYADIILSTHDQSILASRPFWCTTFPVEVPGVWQERAKNPSRPLICSNTNGFSSKGTSYFLDFIEKAVSLNLSYDVRFHSTISERDLIKSFGSSDFVIENLLIPYYGKTGVQAMLSGCVPVVAGFCDLFPFPDARPVWEITIPSLFERLVELINLPNNERRRLQSECEIYARKFHSIEAFREGLSSLIRGSSPGETFSFVQESAFAKFARENKL